MQREPVCGQAADQHDDVGRRQRAFAGRLCHRPGEMGASVRVHPVGSPQLAIEVQSPSGTRPQLRRKIDLYLKSGSLAVWVVHPKKLTVMVFSPLDSLSIGWGKRCLCRLELWLGEMAMQVEELFKTEE